MSNFGRAFLAILVLFAIGLAGCGGGSGGIGDGNTTPAPSDSRALTGKIVDYSTGVGVPNIVVRLGATTMYAVSDANGDFQIPVAEGKDLPIYMKVDTSADSTKYPTTNPVQYNEQRYSADKIDMPLSILNGEVTTLGTILLFQAGSSPPATSKGTVVYGRVISKKTSEGIPNATIRFGTDPTFVVNTGARGFFGVDMGKGRTVLSVFPKGEVTFSASTSDVSSIYPVTYKVGYDGTNYFQSGTIGAEVFEINILVPAAIVAGESNDLGVITIVDDGSDGGTPPTPGGGDDGGGNPPPPPF